MQRKDAVEDKRETFFLVGADIKRNLEKEEQLLGVMDFLDELEKLAQTALMKVVGRIWQSIQVPSSANYIGSKRGKERNGSPLGCIRC